MGVDRENWSILAVAGKRVQKHEQSLQFTMFGWTCKQKRICVQGGDRLVIATRGSTTWQSMYWNCFNGAMSLRLGVEWHSLTCLCRGYMRGCAYVSV